MGKKSLYGCILLVFIIYVVAIMSFPKTTVFWIAFAFSLFAFSYQFYTIHILMKKQVHIKDRIYDFPLLRVSVLYLIMQIGVSLLLMFFAVKVPVFAAALVEMIFLTIAVAGNFIVQASSGEVIRQDIQLEKKLMRMGELQERVNRLIVQCDEEQMRVILQKLGEEVRYCNPVSQDISEEVEEEIAGLFSEIEEMALEGDFENVVRLCGRMEGLLKERERICRCRS